MTATVEARKDELSGAWKGGKWKRAKRKTLHRKKLSDSHKGQIPWNKGL